MPTLAMLGRLARHADGVAGNGWGEDWNAAIPRGLRVTRLE